MRQWSYFSSTMVDTGTELQSDTSPLHSVPLFNDSLLSTITRTSDEKLSLNSATLDDSTEPSSIQFRASRMTGTSPQALRWLESQRTRPLEGLGAKYIFPGKSQLKTIDARDRGTPDDWVERSPCIVRLTGNHPFNGEPDMSDLFAEGFITPVWKHFTRNHGKAANCDWRTHTLSVKGLVNEPRAFTMDELVQMPSITMPVQISCAGNRRREVNTSKQTMGFNWGYGAHGCSMWTGVKLSHLLEICGIDMKRARHIHLNGSTLEGNKTGTFGTSIDLSVAMNPWGDVMVAYLQNGMPLTPDHGFPIRAIVPGFIGGRTVKWLEEVVVSESPSQSYYHFNDNRILPSHVDAERARKENWLSRPEYLYNQAQVNSAIAFPRNGELFDVNSNDSYVIQGFGFSGGGRKITRVEVSLDLGCSWELAQTDYPEERLSHAPRNGNYYCWMFWRHTVLSSRLLEVARTSGEIRCRAWDAANNTQPTDFSWNLMGMGNNSHYRVKILSKYQGGNCKLQFIHPTVAGSSPLGWMTTDNFKGKTPMDGDTKPGARDDVQGLPVYPMSEVAKHCSSTSTWVVIEGQIYDVTSYLDEHPGGAASILMDGGKDATRDFLDIHSEHAKGMLRDFLIGRVAVTNRVTDLGLLELHERTSEHNSSCCALSASEWRSFELAEKRSVTPDTKVFTFKLPRRSRQLGIAVGQHLYVEANINGKKVMRAYTPITDDDDCDSFSLCVKVYKAASDPRYASGGKMSLYLDSLCAGDKVRIKGPAGQLEYMGSGNIKLRERTAVVSNIGLICGGTGITPAYQIIRSVYKNRNDSTQVHLLYASHSEEDIILRQELDAMSSERSNIHIWYTVSSPTEHWEYGRGRVTIDMVRQHIPGPSSTTFVGLCGPPGLLRDVAVPALSEMGYKSDGFLVL